MVFGCALVWNACSASGSKDRCQADVDCPAPLICIDHACIDPGSTGDDPGDDPGDLRGTAAVETNWEQGLLQRDVPEEGSPVGPSSFAVADNGRILVLDGVGSRIQVFEDGQVVNTIPIPGEAFEDIELMPNGSIALLDRAVQDALVFIDFHGNQLGAVLLEGPGIEHPGLITGLACLDDGCWVEVHPNWVHITDAAGQTDAQRLEIAGRPSYNGRALLSLARLAPEAATVKTQPLMADVEEITTSVRFTGSAHWLMGPLSDAAGRMVVAAQLIADEPDAASGDTTEIVVMDPQGQETDRISLPPPTEGTEIFRCLRLTPEGVVYHMAVGDAGVTIRRIDP